MSDVLDKDDDAYLAFGHMASQAAVGGLVPPAFLIFWGRGIDRG